MKRVIQVVLALLALGFFFWTVSELGWARVWETVARIGAWAPIILLPYLIVYLVDCAAWAETLPARRIPFATLFRIRWAGEAVNHLVPSAYVGGEAVKIFLLRKHGVSASDGAVSAVLSKTIQAITQLLFIMLAAVAALVVVPSQAGRMAAVMVVLAAGTGGIAAIAAIIRIGLFRLALQTRRLLPRRASEWLRGKEPKLLALDQTIQQFRKTQPRRFRLSMVLYFAGWLLDMVEIMLVGWLLGAPITWGQALVVEAFTCVSKVAGTWIPGSLGVQESSIVLMARVVGLPDAFGAAYAVIRRARELIFALAGLLLFYSFGARLGGASTRLTASESAT